MSIGLGARSESQPGAHLQTHEPATAGPSASRERRIEFLDALRGLAALAVAVQHGSEFIWPAYGRWSTEVFRPGEFGVFLFFLTSGFIIPVSIERYRSVGRFWVGRFFRLYPLYWSLLLAAVALHKWGPYPFGLSPEFLADWVRNLGANLTMAQELTGHPLVLGQSWTLAYELVFYLLISLLFIARVGHKPARFAVAGFVAAAVIGTRVPPRLVTDVTARRFGFVLLATAAVIVVAVWFSDRSAKSIILCTLLGGMAVPLFLNNPQHMWFALLLVSTMFAGSVIYRAMIGELAVSRAVGVIAVAVASIIVTHLIWFTVDVDPTNGGRTSWRAETLTFLAAYALFGVGLSLRRFSFPRPLRFLGEISYSLYLVHGIVIQVVPRWDGNDWLTLARWLILSIVISALTWRLIEKPFQILGRRVAKLTTRRAERDLEPLVAPAR